MFAVIVAAVMAATSVSLAVDSDVSCVNARSLTERLSRSGISVRQGATTAVTIHQRPAELVVEARNGATRFRRELKRSSSCGAEERAVALLVSSWLRQLPQAERTIAKVEPAPIKEPAPEPVVAEEPPSEDVQPPEPPPVVVAAPEVIVDDEPEETVVTIAPEPPKKATLPTVDIALLGGGTVGTTPDIAGAGTLAGTIGYGRFGFGADIGFESIRSVDVAPARIETVSKWATLNGGVAFQPAERLAVDFTLGLRVWHIGAVALNVENSSPASLWSVGGTLSAGATFRIASSLSAELRVFTSIRHRPERFMLDNAGTVMTLQMVQGGLLLGVSWRAFGN